MTIRDVAVDFAYQPPTSSSKESITGAIFGAAGTYVAQNSIDAAPFGSFLTELTANDTQLAGLGEQYQPFAGGTVFQVGQTFYYTESGIGNEMKLVVNWTQAVNTLTSVRTQLITSASAQLSNPVVIIDFGVQPVSLFVAGYRQIMPLPKSPLWQRYIGLQFITAGSPGTAGAYVAWIGLDVDSEVLGYVEGFSIK